MLVRCEQEHLRGALVQAARVAPQHGAMPILANVLLEATAGGLRVVATDLELGIRAQIPAEVERGGLVTLPARLLAEIVAHLPAAPVEIQVEEGSAVAEIRCQRSSFELVGMPASDFPRVPEGDVEAVCTVPADLLRTMIRQTLFAASTDETRPFLTGVHVNGDADELRFVATDGSILALRKATVKMARPMSAIVPRKAMNELVRLTGGAEEEVRVGLVDNKVVFSGEGWTLWSRPIDGRFPNYEAVIPREFKQRVRVETGRLYEALLRVAITARDPATTVRLEARDGVLRLSSSTAEVGSAREELEVEASGEAMEVGLNAKYVLRTLQAAESDRVALEFTSPLTPCLVRPAVQDPDILYVIAPVRLAR